MTCTKLRKRNLQTEREFLITAENIVIKTSYAKEKIDNLQIKGLYWKR